MAARVVRFASRADFLKREQAARLREAVEALEPEAPQSARKILAVIDRQTAADKGWSFVMLSPAQNRAVVRWIMAHARRQSVTLALWTEFFCHMRTDTGEVCMSRSEMMEAAGASSSHVSDALRELVEIGALIRHRQGREVRWFMNPRVATCLTGAAREDAQRASPAVVRLVEAGKPGRPAR